MTFRAPLESAAGPPPPGIESSTLGAFDSSDLTFRARLGAIQEHLARKRLHGGPYRTFRYGLDRVLASVALVLALPLMLAIAIAIRLDSKGPALFRQMRVGRHGRPFAIIKFRTMQADASPYSEKKPDSDPSITRVGHLLRRTCLDELPQLLNVVWGQMALIGPRPEQLPLLSHYSGWQLDRLLVKPGITGWWQLRHRDPAPIYLDVEQDLLYIEKQSPALDLLIAWKTVVMMARGLRPRRAAFVPPPLVVAPLPAETDHGEVTGGDLLERASLAASEPIP